MRRTSRNVSLAIAFASTIGAQILACGRSPQDVERPLARTSLDVANPGPDGFVTFGPRSVFCTSGLDHPCELGAGSVVGRRAVIEFGLYGPGSTFAPESLASDSYVDPELTLGYGARITDATIFGPRVTVANLANIRNLSLYDDGIIGRAAHSQDSSFGPNSSLGSASVTLDVHGDAGDVRVGQDARLGPIGNIGQGVVVGRGAEVQAKANVGDAVRIGAGAIVCPGVDVPEGTVVPRGTTYPPEGCGVTHVAWRDADGDGTGDPTYRGVFAGSTPHVGFIDNDTDCHDFDPAKVGGEPSCP